MDVFDDSGVFDDRSIANLAIESALRRELLDGHFFVFRLQFAVIPVLGP